MQMLEMIKNQAKLMFRNRIAVFATIALPLILTWLFSNIGSTDVSGKLYVSDSDKSIYSKQLISLIRDKGNVEIINIEQDAIKNKLDDQQISMALVIDKNFGNDLISQKKQDICIMLNYESADNVLLEQIITRELSTLQKIILHSKYVSSALADSGGYNNYFVSSNMFNSIAKKINEPSNITVSSEETDGSASGKQIDGSSRVLIGFLVLFLWFVVVQGSRTLIDEKENKIYHRVLTTPTKYIRFLICKFISVYIYGLVNIIVVLSAGKLLFKIFWIKDIYVTGAVFALYLFVLTGVTMLFVPRVKTQQQLTATATIIIMFTGILGGTFFPLEIAPAFIRLLSKFTPQSWAMAALTGNIGITSELISLSVFVIVGLASIVISFVLVNRNIKHQSTR